MRDYVKEDQLILRKIQRAINDVDAVNLLSKISMITHTYRRQDPYDNEKYRDEPYLHFLTGLLLKEPYVSKKPVTDYKIKRILSLLEDYFNNFRFYILDLFVEEKELDVSNPIFISRMITGLRQVNDGGYQYQFDDFITNVYSPLDDYFLKKYGFTVSNATSFGQKISQWVQKQLDIHHMRSMRNIMHFSTVQQILPYVKDKGFNLQYLAGLAFRTNRKSRRILNIQCGRFCRELCNRCFKFIKVSRCR